jgi:hypothetical protein
MTPHQASPAAARPVPRDGSHASPEKKVKIPQPTMLSTTGISGTARARQAANTARLVPTARPRIDGRATIGTWT